MTLLSRHASPLKGVDPTSVAASSLLMCFCAFQGGGEQSLQETGCSSPPRQMCGTWQRRRLQGRGERSHLAPEEHQVGLQKRTPHFSSHLLNTTE